jgi:hypothetical protein
MPRTNSSKQGQRQLLGDYYFSDSDFICSVRYALLLLISKSAASMLVCVCPVVCHMDCDDTVTLCAARRKE